MSSSDADSGQSYRREGDYAETDCAPLGLGPRLANKPVASSSLAASARAVMRADWAPLQRAPGNVAPPNRCPTFPITCRLAVATIALPSKTANDCPPRRPTVPGGIGAAPGASG